MRLFGKKAKVDSSNPLPPELERYYHRTTGARVRRAALFVLPLLVLGVIIGVLVYIGWRYVGQHNQAPNHSASSQAGNGNQSKSNKSTETQHASTDHQSKQPTKKPSVPSIIAARPTPVPTPTTTPAPALVNTGPSSATLALPAATTLIGAMLLEAYQWRALKRHTPAD